MLLFWGVVGYQITRLICMLCFDDLWVSVARLLESEPFGGNCGLLLELLEFFFTDKSRYFLLDVLNYQLIRTDATQILI